MASLPIGYKNLRQIHHVPMESAANYYEKECILYSTIRQSYRT